MSVEIKYKGNTIASANTDTTKTLKTSGKYCEADILIENVQDGGREPVLTTGRADPSEEIQYLTPPEGFDGFELVTVNPIPSSYIVPSGSIDITENGTYDVTQFASALVNVSGGGSLPSSISKIDGGSFTVASDTSGTRINVSHNLGIAPTGFLIWTDDIAYGSTESVIYIVRAFFNVVSYSATQDAVYYLVRKATSGAFGTTQAAIAITAHTNWVTSSTLNIGVSSQLKGGCTYNWFAWA